MANLDIYNLPTGFSTIDILIDGQSVRTMVVGYSIFENIYTPAVTATILMGDSQSIDFLNRYEIEGGEKVSIEAEDADGNTLKFEGHLNGIRNKIQSNQKMAYVLDVMDLSVLHNEQNFITKRFVNSPPEDVINECLGRLGDSVKLDYLSMPGKPMNFLSSRWKPFHCIEYVLRRAVNDTSSTKSEDGKGSGGYFFWKTTKGYRGAPISDVVDGKIGSNLGKFTYQLGKSGNSFESQRRAIVSYDFKRVGDQFEKLRMGSYKNVLIVFDIDKGVYKEIEYDDSSDQAKKHKDFAEKPTRYFFTTYSEERYNDKKDMAAKGKYDQSDKNIQQTVVGNGMFNDKVGEMMVPLNYSICAGDRLEIEIPKLNSGDGRGETDEKFGGVYTVVAVGHHSIISGDAYSKISILRSDKQQDQTSAAKTTEL